MSSMVALSKIQIPSNIRTIEGVEDLHGTPLNEFPLDEKATILSLANNIQRYGLLQPLVVKDLGKDKGFRLIAGYRRFKAVQHNGSTTVDVKSVKGKTEDEAILKLIENVQRENLNPLDVAKGLEEIKRLKGITKQSALAEIVNMSPGWVSQHLSLLKSDEEVQKAVRTGEMGLQAARTISSLPSDQQAGAVKDAKKEAKAAGKKKVSSKGARRQATKSKAKAAGKQTVLKPVADREKEQKEAACKEFFAVRYGDKEIPENAKGIVEDFWDYLMSKNRLYIFQD